MSTPIELLIKQYDAGTYQLEKYRKSLDARDPLAAEEAETVSGMLSDMRYALDWMKRGRRPGSRRGAERTDIYRQREIYAELQPMPLSIDDRRNLTMTLLELTERERTCFLLHMAHGLTISEIADRLEVSRRSVQTFLQRAKSKVQQRIS